VKNKKLYNKKLYNKKLYNKNYLYNKMKTKEILSIAALVAIALCLICGVVKTAIKSPKQKQTCDTACALLIFVAVVLVGISQLLDEKTSSDGVPLGGICNPSERKNCVSPGKCVTSPDAGYGAPGVCMTNIGPVVLHPLIPPGNTGGPCRTETYLSSCKNGERCKDGRCPPSMIQPNARGAKGGLCYPVNTDGHSPCNTGLHCNNLIPPTCVENPPGPMHMFGRSFSCEGGRCGFQQVAPDESKGYYATMAKCKAKCKA